MQEPQDWPHTSYVFRRRGVFNVGNLYDSAISSFKLSVAGGISEPGPTQSKACGTCLVSQLVLPVSGVIRRQWINLQSLTKYHTETFTMFDNEGHIERRWSDNFKSVSFQLNLISCLISCHRVSLREIHLPDVVLCHILLPQPPG